MVPPSPAAPSVRLAKGQQRTQPQAAVVTEFDTLALSPRTPEDLVAPLLQDADRPEPTARPQPVDHARRATLAGNAVAMSRLAQRAAQRQGPPSSCAWRAPRAPRRC